MELGRQKKLWALEIMYNVPGENKTKIIWKRNMTGEELQKTREGMFRYGFEIPVEPGHWKIICPMDIVTVDCYRQDNYVAAGSDVAPITDQPSG
jgi:hypothetical protein